MASRGASNARTPLKSRRLVQEDKQKAKQKAEQAQRERRALRDQRNEQYERDLEQQERDREKQEREREKREREIERKQAARERQRQAREREQREREAEQAEQDEQAEQASQRSFVDENVTPCVLLSDIDKLLAIRNSIQGISGSFLEFLYGVSGDDRDNYDHKFHPKQSVQELVDLMNPEFTNDRRCLDMLGEYKILQRLLAVIPLLIERNNIADGTADQVDKDTLKKQSTLLDKINEALSLMMRNRQLGTVILHHLFIDKHFSELFLEDAGKSGYNSNILKNKVAMGLSLLLCELKENHPTLDQEDVNELMKLLGKCSVKNDDTVFWSEGMLEQITMYLLATINKDGSTNNRDHQKTLWCIMNDMFQNQQYDRQQTPFNEMLDRQQTAFNEMLDLPDEEDSIPAANQELEEVLHWWRLHAVTFDPETANDGDKEMFGKAKNILTLFGRLKK